MRSINYTNGMNAQLQFIIMLRGSASKGWVFCNAWNVSALIPTKGHTPRFYQPSPDVLISRVRGKLRIDKSKNINKISNPSFFVVVMQ